MLSIIIFKKESKKNGKTYLSASIKAGQFSKPDFWFISINNVMALTGLSINDIDNAPVGVLKEINLEV